MHIRLLKVSLLPGPTSSLLCTLSCVITLTTDLGELSYPKKTSLVIKLYNGLISHKSEVIWTGASVVEKYTISVPRRKDFVAAVSEDWQLAIYVDHEYKIAGTTLGASSEQTTVLKRHVHSFCQSQGSAADVVLGLQTSLKHGLFQKNVSRQFTLSHEMQVVVLEETHDSIVSHLWDSGILLSALAASAPTSPLTTALTQVFQDAETVIELGTGTGILGMTIAKLYGTDASRKRGQTAGAYIVMTDLPTAEYLVRTTLNHQQNHDIKDIAFAALDWTMPEQIHDLVQNCPKRRGSSVIVLADVTYNDAMHDALYDTLENLLTQLSQSAGSVKIIFMSKYRHISEKHFIERLKNGYMVDMYSIIDGQEFSEQVEVKEVTEQDVRLGDFEFLLLSRKPSSPSRS